MPIEKELKLFKQPKGCFFYTIFGALSETNRNCKACGSHEKNSRERKYMLVEKVKSLLGEELSAKVEEALKGKGKDGADVDLCISNDGSFVPAEKLTNERALRTTAENTIKTLNGQIEDLKKLDAAGLSAEVEKLKGEKETAEKSYNNQIQQLKKSFAFKDAALKAGVRDSKDVEHLFDLKALSLKNDGTLEVDFTSLKTEKPYLFNIESKTPAGTPPAAGGGKPGPDTSKMSYAELCDYAKSNPGATL